MATSLDPVHPSIVSIDSKSYLLGSSYDSPVQISEFEQDPTFLSLFTVIRHPQGTEANTLWLQAKFEAFQESDDIWNKSFLSHVLLQWKNLETKPSNDDLLLPDMKICLHDCQDVDIPEGPYVMVGKKLLQVFRLFPDTHGAFVCGVVPRTTDQSSKEVDSENMRYI